MRPQTRLVTYPKIKRFQELVEEISCLPDRLPMLDFEGTLKLPGTQAALTLNLETDHLTLQSRHQVLGPDADPCGFVKFAQQHQAELIALMRVLSQGVAHWFANGNLLTLYGVWAGEDLKHGVAPAQLPGCLSVFALKHSPEFPDSHSRVEEGVWLDPRLPSPFLFAGLEQISDYARYHLQIDFNSPASLADAQQQITRWLASLDSQCPVAQAKGVRGMCEGIVWVHQSEQQGRIAFQTESRLPE